jgi:ABC-type branched-subunit amino acid transport system substrate-binding protein
LDQITTLNAAGRQMIQLEMKNGETMFGNTSRAGKKRFGAMVLITAGGLALTACGGSSGGGSAAGSKDPIVLFQTNSFSGQVSNKPQTKTAAEAAVREVNAAGGVNGRKLKLVTCDNTGDPNMTNACVKKAKEANAAAFVGSANYFPATWKLLNQEKIPYLLGNGLVSDEYKSPVSFPLAGQPGWYYGIAAYLKELGAKHVAQIHCEIAACAYGANLLDEALVKQGMPKTRAVVAPLATTDYSSFAVSAMQGNPDAIIVSGSEATATLQAKAVRQQGYKGTIMSVSACITADAAKSLGAAGEGIYVVGLTTEATIKTDQIQQFINDMNAVDPKAKKDDVALGAWAGVKLFAKVAEGLDTVDASTVLKALQTAKVGAYDIGVIAPVPGVATSPIAGMPGLAFSPSVTYNQVKGGTMVQTKSGFLNPFPATS